MEHFAEIICSGGACGRGGRRACEPPRRPEGFTLVELLVVLALVMLISVIALPSVARIFDSGADAMAYNQMSAQLEAARVYALENSKPAGIHLQLADPVANPDLEGVQFVTVIARDENIDNGTAQSGTATTLTDNSKSWTPGDMDDYVVEITAGTGTGQSRTIQSNTVDTLTVTAAWTPPLPDASSQYAIIDPLLTFGQAAGHVPRRLPRSMAIGDAENFTTGGNWQEVTDEELTGIGLPGGERCFTRFSMIFASTGVLIRTIDGQNIKFKKYGNGLFSGAAKLWEPPAPGDEQMGITALTIFNYEEVSPLSAVERQAYLNESAQYLPVSFYTGMFYLRRGQ